MGKCAQKQILMIQRGIRIQQSPSDYFKASNNFQDKQSVSENQCDPLSKQGLIIFFSVFIKVPLQPQPYITLLHSTIQKENPVTLYQEGRGGAYSKFSSLSAYFGYFLCTESEHHILILLIFCLQLKPTPTPPSIFF